MEPWHNVSHGQLESPPMSICRLREMRNQAVTPIIAPTQMDPMLSHITLPVKCTSPVHMPANATTLQLGSRVMEILYGERTTRLR